MDRMSIEKLLDLPPAFGATLLILSLILSLAPYLPSGVYGPITIPEIDNSLKRRLKLWGPFTFAISMALFVPVVKNTENTVTLENPYGARQILLDGTKLLITADEFPASTTKPRGMLSYPKQLFYIEEPKEGSGFRHELSSTKAYAEALSPKITGSIFSQFPNLNNSLLSDLSYRQQKCFGYSKSHRCT